MGLVALVAAAITALRSNDQISAAIVLALTISALCTSTLVAIYRRGAWAGFAVFGWALFLVCQPHSAPSVGPTSLPMAMAYRVVFYVSDPVEFPRVSFQIPGYPAIMTDGRGEPFLAAVSGGSAGGSGRIPINSLRSGLCLLSIVAGVVGALVGSFIARRCAGRGEVDGRSPPDRDGRIG